MKLDPEILRAYDIRGVVGQNLDVKVAFSVGRAFATVVAERLGHPPRPQQGEPGGDPRGDSHLRPVTGGVGSELGTRGPPRRGRVCQPEPRGAVPGFEGPCVSDSN